MSEEKITPLMRQYFEIKKQYPDAVILFQVGDFYELFFDDAKMVSAFLAIALTKRGTHNGEHVPLCGVPVHALNHYLVKLIRGGFKVALCDQITKPQPGKVVERAVTQVYTPGTLLDEQMLDGKSASYLLSFYPGDEQWGLIFTELLTAQMFATVVSPESYRMIESELIRFFPDEIIIPSSKHAKKFDTYFRQQGYSVSMGLEDEESFAPWMENQFKLPVLQQLVEATAIKGSLSLLHWYLKKNQERALVQLTSLQFYQPEDYLILDAATQRNLEIFKSSNEKNQKNTLFAVVDKAATSMGSRLIKKWLQRPLVQKQGILQRQEVVCALTKDLVAMEKFGELFRNISDLERIVGRIALNRALVNDYLALRDSLKIVPQIKAVVLQHLMFYLTDVVQAKLRDFNPIVELLQCALNDDLSRKWIIKTGFDQELDRLRVLVENSQQEILKLERQEIEKTGITSLKIRYTSISGYSIEVTKANLKLVPERYILQQTLVNRNRYVTQELKDLEREIIKSQNEIEAVEQTAFERVKKSVEGELPSLRQVAQALSYLDALLGFARVAYEHNYVAPEFHNGRDIIIKQGRHPFVEIATSGFVPNDTNLTDAESLLILTGPNMGGKSTYLRQVALLSILAQSGSMIPAQSARLPVLDRIFTRIGSGDNLAEGKSTFLVEMEEAAVICNQATKYSLVILDEVGRGTSTFDGIALAQAIIEHIAQNICARCLFATHYHELTKLKDAFPCIENYHMACKRDGDGILFLHQLRKGVALGSFGIEVAKLAQLPQPIITRASQILTSELSMSGASCYYQESNQLGGIIAKLEQELDERNLILRDLESVSVDDLSPRQAFDLIWKMKKNWKN